MKRILILTFVFSIFISCNEVEEFFLGKAPVLGNIVVYPSDRVFPLDTITVSIAATNPEEGPLQYSWTENGGRFIQPADKDTVYWIADIIGGTYKLEAHVSNSVGTSSTAKNIHVQSTAEPIVNILEPSENQYFILYSKVKIKVNAFHENYITVVRFYVVHNQLDTLIKQQNFNPENIYEYEFETFPELVGKTTIRIEAQSQIGKVGSDSILIKIGGIIPGEVRN